MTTADEDQMHNDSESVAGAAADTADAETPTTDTADAETATADTIDAEPTTSPDSERASQHKRAIAWTRVLAYGVLPALAMLAALCVGYLKWVDTTAHETQTARSESVRAATDGTVAMLSYKNGTVEKDLGAAEDRLTGRFKDSYHELTHDVVIPGAKQQQIAASASVPAAASVSATAGNAVVLVFVNQAVTIGTGAPTNTASSVRVTLDKIGGHWLISDFTPV